MHSNRKIGLVKRGKKYPHLPAHSVHLKRGARIWQEGQAGHIRYGFWEGDGGGEKAPSVECRVKQRLSANPKIFNYRLIFTNSSTFTHENGTAFKKDQQLARFKTYPVLIAQRLAGHESFSFIRIYDLS